MLRYMDSFDHYATADLPLKYTRVSNVPSIHAGNGRRGAALQVTSTDYVLKMLDGQATWIVGAAFYTDVLQAAALFALWDAGALQVDLRLKTDGNLQVTRNATVLGTGTTPLAISTFYYVELKVKIHSSTGTIDVQVNGTSLISLTGQNTQNTGNATANQVLIGASAGNTGSATFRFDDLYICDGQGSVNKDFLGDSRVDCYLPTGNGSNSAFTNNSGNSTNNYTHVNEASQDGDTSYVADATVSDIDSYAITGLTHNPSSIFGLQTNLIAKKDDAGARSICPLLYRSATAHAGTGIALSAYTDLNQIYEQDPATSATWTKANINATEFGEKVSA
jgi:hypothetical protein